jgi:predicted regulator of Ras-like GTPase activity (Roadblock/LC7/MglB family)
MTPETMVLDRVTRVPGVRGAVLASAGDGLIVAEQLMDGVDGRAAAALAGARVGRLLRTTGAAGLESPLFIHLRAEEGSLLAAPAAGDLVLVALVGPDANIGLARLEMLDAAGRLG